MTPLSIVLIVLAAIIVASIILCLSIKELLGIFLDDLRFLYKETVSVWDVHPSNCGLNAIWAWPLFIITCILLIAFVSIVLVITPILSISQFIKEKRRKREDKPESPPLFVNRFRNYHFNVLPFNDGHGSFRVQVPYQFIEFEPSTDEILFYTPSSDSVIESLIQAHFDEIDVLFKDKDKTFMFLPVFNQNINANLNQAVFTYYKPDIKTVPSIPDNYLSYQDIQIAYHLPNVISKPSLIRCARYDSSCVILTVRPLVSQNIESLISEIQDYLEHVGNGRQLYHIDSEETIKAGLANKDADERFDADVDLIGQEIRERIDLLRARGLSSLAIRKLIGDDSDKPSRLIIDSQYRIILPDYDNKEINLSPIHKAVFFLFLRHPEGIYFKNLSDCRDELSSIYKRITGREDLSAVEESIDRLTNPLDNSINEKCARIRNAFVSEFREELADWYTINGKRGEAKRIRLPQDLITWQSPI